VNVESKVRQLTNLAMLKLVTRSRTPFPTREPIECLPKVLDGTPITCGLGISKGPHVLFKISFSIAIMSSVLNF
jgi:hypothetical protein